VIEPALTDDEKRALCERLIGWGLMRRDEHGRFLITAAGYDAGAMLAAAAMYEQAVEQAEDTRSIMPH
jgi:hypothetical protein